MPVKIDNKTINNTSTTNSNLKSASNVFPNPSASASSFLSVMKNASLDKFNGSMQDLLSIVRNLGEEFLNSPQENSLNNYRESIKYFLKRLKEEFLSLKDEFGCKKDGEQRVYQLVDIAGGKADSFTKEAFSNEKALELLSNLDDIRGLVLDIIG